MDESENKRVEQLLEILRQRMDCNFISDLKYEPVRSKAMETLKGSIKRNTAPK